MLGNQVIMGKMLRRRQRWSLRGLVRWCECPCALVPISACFTCACICVPVCKCAYVCTRERERERGETKKLRVEKMSIQNEGIKLNKSVLCVCVSKWVCVGMYEYICLHIPLSLTV